ncbi:MAG: histidine phosphatase family protein [Euzebya sp.]
MSDTAQGSGRLVLVRHAETEWSLAGRHTGTTDLPLTAEGRVKAGQTAQALQAMTFKTVLTSPLQRARTTCQIAGYADRALLRDELVEWDYGDYEGLSTEQIRERDPGWELWTDGAPHGESPEQVQARIDQLVVELTDLARDGDVAIFAHGHILRALAVRWADLPITAGRVLRLGTATISTLNWKREIRVIDRWNDDSHLRQP